MYWVRVMSVLLRTWLRRAVRAPSASPTSWPVRVAGAGMGSLLVWLVLRGSAGSPGCLVRSIRVGPFEGTGGAPTSTAALAAAASYSGVRGMPGCSSPVRAPLSAACCIEIIGSYLFGGDQGGDPLRLVDLDKVPGVVEQMQLAAGEQRGEVASDPGVEGPVPAAEDDLDRAGEAA